LTRSPRPDARERNRQIGKMLATETAKILRARDDFDPGAFAEYLVAVRPLELLYPPPDRITPEWVHRVAEAAVDEFMAWRRGRA
jgi:hypothetical protein